MSDIPQAREIIQSLLKSNNFDPDVKAQLRKAVRLMLRVKYCRRAPAKRQRINRHLRARIRHLVYNSDLTMHEIANRVGLRSGGRISEVMHGRR